MINCTLNLSQINICYELWLDLLDNTLHFLTTTSLFILVDTYVKVTPHVHTSKTPPAAAVTDHYS